MDKKTRTFALLGVALLLVAVAVYMLVIRGSGPEPVPDAVVGDSQKVSEELAARNKENPNQHVVDPSQKGKGRGPQQAK
jgi:hypothetical protein